MSTWRRAAGDASLAAEGVQQATWTLALPGPATIAVEVLVEALPS